VGVQWQSKAEKISHINMTQEQKLRNIVNLLLNDNFHIPSLLKSRVKPWIVIPPSTQILCPVMYAALGMHRKATTPAIS
jgi:hypothetical protein